MVMLNTVILNKVKVQSINDIALTDISPNKLRGDEIRLGAVYISDVTDDGVLGDIFQGKNYITMN